ncbi:MAG: substrate-binding domain-containing protein [Magnetococcales bacterium]|nr:substrate-binding domain-containing protein [Magnetococcales bacterium]
METNPDNLGDRIRVLVTPTRRLIGWFLALLLLLPPSLAAADTLKISGTGSAIPAMEQIVAAFRQAHSDQPVRILTPPMGSSGSIRALLGEALDLALSARSLKENERQAGLISTPYARTPFVVAVHESLPVSHLSLGELTDIYAGKTLTWPDGKRLRLVMRPSNDSDITVLKSISPEMKKAVETALAKPGKGVAINDFDSVEMIEKVPGAVGTATLTLIVAHNLPLKALGIHHAFPTIKALTAGNYPYFKTFNLVTRSDPSPGVKRFQEFLRSPPAREILIKAGNQALLP